MTTQNPSAALVLTFFIKLFPDNINKNLNEIKNVAVDT